MTPLIRFSSRHPLSVLMALLALFLSGAGSLAVISIDLLPHLGVRRLLVATEYEGISAGEMRKMVTMPIEDSLASLKGLKNISSLSRDGLSLVSLELHWGVDADIALVECREIIDIAFETLPARCKKPVVQKDDAASSETVKIVLTARDGDLLYARHVVDTDIKPRLQRLAGVGAVHVLGGEKEEIKVNVYREKMEAKRITLENIAQKLSSSNFEYPAGNIREGEKELLVKTAGLYASLDEIAETPLVFNESGLVKVLDVADVSRGTEEKFSFFIYDGKPSVKIGVSKKQGASPVVVAGEVKKEIARLNLLYGNTYDFRIVEDESRAVIESVLSLLVSALFGMLVTFVIIFYFFRSLRLSLILTFVIPLSALASVLVLAICGKTLNTMSLSGIAIGIGMVVDAGAVTLENLQKKLSEKLHGEGTAEGTAKAASGTLSLAEIDTCVEEVKLSNVGSTLTTVIVFIPVLFMHGLLSELFSDMAIAIITSVSASCILSFTYIPALFTLCCRCSQKSAAQSVKSNNALVDFLVVRYRRILTGIFARRALIFAILLASVLVGVVSLRFIKTETLPTAASNEVEAEMIFPYGTRIDYLSDTASALYERLSHESYITNLYIAGGIEKDDFFALSKPNVKAERIVIDFSVDTDVCSVIEAKKRLSALFDSGRFAVSAQFAFVEKKDAISEIFAADTGASLLVSADSPENASRLAVQYAGESAVMPLERVPEFVFTPDRITSSRFQVSTMYAASVARNALMGVESAPYYERGVEIPVKVLLYERYVDTIDEIESLGVQLQDGSLVPIRTLGNITRTENEKTLYRYNRKDAKLIAKSHAKSAGNDAKSHAKIEGETGAAVSDLGALRVQEMLGSGVWLLAGVLVLLYLLMGAQFESFLLPLIFLLALPPAFSGAFVFLAAFGKTLNINSIIALVILFGIGVNNSIILYENCMLNISRKKMPPANAAVPNMIAASLVPVIIDSCVEKFRAILITSGTTICALIPFAIDPFNKSAQSSLALAIIGGLLVSCSIVLGVVPVILAAVLKPKSEAPQ